MKDLDLSIFPAVSKKEWHKLAENQLRGDDPKEKLRWENLSNIQLEPYYDPSDLDGLTYLSDFFSSISSHRWKLYEQIQVADEKAANKSALKALMGGCDGIVFLFKDAFDAELLMKGIDTSICDVSFIGGFQLPEALQKTSGMQINESITNCLQTNKNSDPLQQALEICTQLGSKNYIYREAFPDFFLEIATVRAIRYLLRSKENIQIHTHIPRHNVEEKQWFLNTTAGLASILGGSHAVDFSTAAGDPRISRNTGHLIREESGIETYDDPCGGSYYVEVLTDKIIKQVEVKLKK